MKKLLSLSLLTCLLSADDLSTYLEHKTKMSDESVSKKEEGSYFTGLPLINYDANKGLGYGARMFWYDNGSKDDPTFEYVPYRQTAFIQFFQTTNGFSRHMIRYEAPYVHDTLFKITTQLVYEKNTQARYFGTDTSSLGALSTPDGQTFDTASAQNEYLKDIGSAYYNRYIIELPVYELNVEYDLFGGLMRVAGGLNLTHANITTYQNAQLDDKKNEKSKLYDDNQASEVVGYEGGFDNGVKISLVYDSRDYIPNPKNGSAHDITAEFYSKALGSDYEHQRYTFSTKNFLTFERASFMTLAFRWIYSVQQGETPFYAKNMMGFADEYQYGLGGLRTLRGYQQDRFVADVKTVANIESRFEVYDTAIAGQEFNFMLVPFMDAGSVFDSVQESSFKDVKTNYGAGVRIAWNLATVIMVDYAQSSEDSGLYINFSHIF